MIDIQTISIVLAACSFILAATYYTFNIRHTIQNRKAQLFNQITSITNQKEWQKDAIMLMNLQWTDFDDFARKYDSGVDIEHYAIRTMHFSVMDGRGYYVKTGQIDVELANTLVGGFYLVWLWLKYKDVVLGYRKFLSLPRYFENFEYLANELIDYNKKRGTPFIYDGRPVDYLPPKKP